MLLPSRPSGRSDGIPMAASPSLLRISRSIARDVRTSGPNCAVVRGTLRRDPVRWKQDGRQPVNATAVGHFFWRAPHAMETNARAYFLPSSFGFSAISASLVNSNVATLAAFSRAVRTTLVGSITPASTKSS